MDGKRIVRRIVLAAFAAVLAAPAFGPATPEAAAQTRSDARDEANRIIERCFRNGGEPVVHEAGEDAITVVCKNTAGGKNLVCAWVPRGGWKSTCAFVLPRPGADGLSPFEPAATDPAWADLDAGSIHDMAAAEGWEPTTLAAAFGDEADGTGDGKGKGKSKGKHRRR
jgi:hypothetical protein